MANAATSKLNGKKNAPSADDLAAQIEILRKDLGGLTETIAEFSKAKGSDAIDAAKSKAADVRDTAADAAETARLQAIELQGQANEFIKHKPATALGIAAGVGFLVGFLSTRK